MECSIKDNLQNCSCTYSSCPRRGHCCACVTHHRENGAIPGCFFSKEGEKTYDRSIENLVKMYKKVE